MLHRPNTIPEDRRSHAAPPVLEFDAAGKFVNAWGGPGSGYDWPDSEHGIAVDYKDRVWIGGSAPVAPSLRNLDDDMLLKFDNKGKFLLQIGGRTVSKGNADTKNVHQSADVFVWPKTNEAFVADGYGNRRVIVFDADTGAFKRSGARSATRPSMCRPRREEEAQEAHVAARTLAAAVAPRRLSIPRATDRRSSAGRCTPSRSRTTGWSTWPIVRTAECRSSRRTGST